MTDTRTPVVFIHGLWLHTASWAPWLDLFKTSGYVPGRRGYESGGQTRRPGKTVLVGC